MGFRLWGNIFSTVLWKKNCVLDFSHVRNSIHNTLSGVSMYCLIHHQGSRCINEYIIRGGVVLENVSSPLRFITKYIHFCLFNKVNVIKITLLYWCIFFSALFVSVGVLFLFCPWQLQLLLFCRSSFGCCCGCGSFENHFRSYNP